MAISHDTKIRHYHRPTRTLLAKRETRKLPKSPTVASSATRDAMIAGGSYPGSMNPDNGVRSLTSRNTKARSTLAKDLHLEPPLDRGLLPIKDAQERQLFPSACDGATSASAFDDEFAVSEVQRPVLTNACTRL